MHEKTLKDWRIIFMGTPEFAVASLDKLVQAGCQVVGVITAPDKAAGRGMQLQQSAVKKHAVEKDLFVLQPEKLKDPAFLEQLKSLQADLQVVVAFRMLPEMVWNMPPLGTINVHGSLLPQYRGAAPINWAIINGEKETGVTTFKLKHEIDTGNILLQSKLPIGENENAGELHDRMKEAGASLLLETLEKLSTDEITEIAQPGSTTDDAVILQHAPKIFTETCQINWHQTTAQIHNLVRGLSPYPAAYTQLEGKKMKVFATEKLLQKTTSLPGTFETDKKTYLRFACSDGYVNILDLQLEGKKRMPVTDFLRGYRFADAQVKGK